jgi:hypothetical protein
MTSPLQTPDFFVLEAGEALDGLEAVLRPARRPAPDELHRGARLLRGAAVMAGQQPIARAAAALEGLARSYRERPDSWDAAVQEQVLRAVEEFRTLLPRVRGWREADTAQALRLGRDLELLAGRGGGEPAGRADPERERGTLQAGVRAFVAREGALVASALDRAARALRVSATDREPLYTVIRRMQSLRGLAELGELAPLPEILDAIEIAVGDLTRMFAPPPGVDEVIGAAALALTRLARDVAESGRPNVESAETRRFTELLVRVFAVEHDVVPIESLYADGDPEPLHRPAAAAGFHGAEELGPLELVSHGEHLCRTADLVSRSRSAIERDLRLYQLLGTLRSISSVGPDPVAGALGVFARAVREALAAGVANSAPAALAACLHGAGELLRSVADNGDRMAISRRLLDVAHQLSQLQSTADVPVGDGGAAVEEPPAAAVDADVVPIEELLLPDSSAVDDELPIVPIASLAPDDETAGASGALEMTYKTYRRLVRERPAALPSLAALLRSTDASPVAIGELCYRGRAALERADTVRRQLVAALAGGDALATVRPLLDELLDLVPLALTES